MAKLEAQNDDEFVNKLYIYRDEDNDAISLNKFIRGPNGGIMAVTVARFSVPSEDLTQEEINSVANAIGREFSQLLRKQRVAHMNDAGKQNTLFNSLLVPCVCEGLPDSVCTCAQAGGAEKVLRFVIKVDGKLSDDQREWCFTEIDRIEGHSRKDHEGQSDAEIARGVLDAWTDYCRDKGLM